MISVKSILIKFPVFGISAVHLTSSKQETEFITFVSVDLLAKRRPSRKFLRAVKFYKGQKPNNLNSSLPNSWERLFCLKKHHWVSYSRSPPSPLISINRIYALPSPTLCITTREQRRYIKK